MLLTKRSKAIAGLLTFALCFSFAPPVMATSGNGVSIAKTDIKAERVTNYQGYGSLGLDLSWELPQAALIDRDGNYVFPYKGTHHMYVYDGGIVSEIGDHPYLSYYGETPAFYKLNGESAFTGDYYGASCMIDGYAFVTECDENWENIRSYVINDKGIIVHEFKDEFVLRVDGWRDEFADGFTTKTIGTLFSEGLMLCQAYSSWNGYDDRELGSLYYVDINGNTVISLSTSKYKDAEYFMSGYAAVMSAVDEKCGFIDKSGKEVIPCEYDAVEFFADGLAPAKKNGKWGYINTNNETVIPFEYDTAFGAGCGLAAVSKNGKYGLVDYANNVVVPLEYDYITPYEENVSYAIKDGYINIITGYTKTDNLVNTGDNQNNNNASQNNGSSSGNTSGITINVNGSGVSWTDAAPFINSDGRTMVPLRAVGDALGLTVSWDNSTREAVFTDGSKTIYFPIGKSTARTSEGSNVTMDTSAVIVNSRTYAPVRYLAEFFGYNVGWDNASRTVSIDGME